MNLRKSLFALALFLSPAVAFAHAGHDHSGVMAGLAHPVFGLDHLLAMLAVGMWAAQQFGAARWALPLTFVGSMLVGGLLGFNGLEIPLMETGIAASVLAFGLWPAGGPWPGAAGTDQPVGLCRRLCCGHSGPACQWLCPGAPAAARGFALGAGTGRGLGLDRSLAAGGLIEHSAQRRCHVAPMATGLTYWVSRPRLMALS